MEPIDMQANNVGGLAQGIRPPSTALTLKADQLLSKSRDLTIQLRAIEERIFGPSLNEKISGASAPEPVQMALDTTLDRLSSSLSAAATIADKLSARL